MTCNITKLVTNEKQYTHTPIGRIISSDGTKRY